MKYLFINPPSYIYNWSPILGIPTLLGILENSNINTELLDLNLLYLNHLLTKEGIDEQINYFSNILSDKSSSLNFLKLKEKKIKEIISVLESTKKKIDFCNYIQKNSKLFFNYPMALYSLRNRLLIIENSYILLNLALSYFLPDIINFRSTINNPNFEINIEELLLFLNSNFIPFKNFCDKEIEKIIKMDPDIIGISINYPTSIFGGLYIAYKLKQKTKIHINIGGSFYNYFYKMHKNLDQFFDIFFDTISIQNNTQTVLDFIKYLENKIPIEEIPNIIYKKNKKLQFNISEKVIPINKLPFESFTGYPLRKYTFPKLCLPVVASTSCYWHKCNFCETCEQKYSTKSAEKIVDELEYLSKKYNTEYFYFWDNSIHPKILDKMSDLIIKKKLNIKYSVFARFEKEFNLKLLKKLKKSGLLYINFGLDTASQRMLDYINKGTTIEEIERILKDCYKAKIGNYAYLILGHPNETIDDIKNDINFVKKNKKYIDNLGVIPQVVFIRGSKLNESRDKYKKLVHTSFEERMKYLKEIKNLTNSQIEFFCYSIFASMYIGHKGFLRYKLEKNIFFFLRKYPKILYLYIMFNKFVYYKFKCIKN